MVTSLSFLTNLTSFTLKKDCTLDILKVIMVMMTVMTVMRRRITS